MLLDLHQRQDGLIDLHHLWHYFWGYKHIHLNQWVKVKSKGKEHTPKLGQDRSNFR